jgi:hypothetical protein
MGTDHDILSITGGPVSDQICDQRPDPPKAMVAEQHKSPRRSPLDCFFSTGRF